MAISPNPDFKKAVVFVYIKNNGKIIPNGTGFLTSVIVEGKPENFQGYIVTSKHVLTDKNTGKYYDSIYLRLNKKDGNSELFEVFLTGKNAIEVFIHKDSTVDVALFQIFFNIKMIDHMFIPSSFLLTKEKFDKLNIREGDEVYFVGLFVPFVGNQKSYPITRFGKVALVTNEKIPWDNTMQDLYLIEIQSFGGNSGSPVIFYLGGNRTPGQLILGPPQEFIAGIMQGRFNDFNQVVEVDANKMKISLENVGIAAVVPAYKLYEILYYDNVKNVRSGVHRASESGTSLP